LIGFNGRLNVLFIARYEKRMLNLWPLYLSLSGIAILFVWMLIDASFGTTAEVLLIQLGIKSDLGMGIKGSMPLDGLGLRVMALAFLVVFVLTFYSVACWRAFTLKRGTDLKGLLLLVSVACIASFVLSQWKPIAWVGFRLRSSWRARAMTEDCKMLLETWPVRNKLVTSLGTLNSPDENPDVSILDPLREGCAFSDQFGPLIYRQGRRVLVDSKTYPFWKLEYSGDGVAPKDFRVDFGHFKVCYKLIEVKRITSQLYLSRYDETPEPAEEKG